MAHQLGVGLFGNGHRADQVQAAVHQFRRRQRVAPLHQAANQRLDAGQFGIAQNPRGEVDAVDEAAAVNPLPPHMPALDGGRIQQVHPHILGFHGHPEQAGLGFGVVLRHPHGADDHIGRALHLGVADGLILEEVGMEQHPQHCPDFVVAVEVGLLQLADGLRVAGFRQAPGGDGRLVGHEEIVELAGHEPGGGGLLADDVHHIAAIPGAGFAQESLVAVVVVGRVEAEGEGGAAIGEHRHGGGQVPAGKGAGAGLDVVLGVVELAVFADAQGEQLQQFPPVVFVDRRLVAFDVVQVVEHGRVGGEPQQQFAEVAHALFAEGVVLHGGGAGVVDLVVAGAEDGVPEQGHLFLELVLVVDHAVNDFGLAGFDGGLVEVRGVGAVEQVFFDAGVGAGVEQFFDDAVVALAGFGFHLVAAGAEAGAAQQMGHQCDIMLVCHIVLLLVGTGLAGTARVKRRPPPGGRGRCGLAGIPAAAPPGGLNTLYIILSRRPPLSIQGSK